MVTYLDCPVWAPIKRERDDQKPAGIADEERGFAMEDLLRIRAYIQPQSMVLYRNLSTYLD